MKTYKFIVIFTNHEIETVFASDAKEAKILAQAKQIKKGNSYNIDHVKWFKSVDDYVIVR